MRGGPRFGVFSTNSIGRLPISTRRSRSFRKCRSFSIFGAKTWRQKGELDRAVADFTEAIRLMPDAVTAYTGRGLAFEGKGELARASNDYEQALRLPSVADAETAKPAQHTAQVRLEAMAQGGAAQGRPSRGGPTQGGSSRGGPT